MLQILSFFKACILLFNCTSDFLTFVMAGVYYSVPR